MDMLRKYNTASHVYIPIVKRGVVDFAVGADWTPAAGDVKISKDGGAAANVTNLPTAIAMGNGAIWDFSLTATELQAAQIVVTVADSATKAVEDQAFIINTFGHASAQYQVDWSDSVRLGLTALPNAAAEAAGGLYTRGTGAGQIAQDANGRVDVSLKAILGTTLTETAGQIAAAFKKFFDKATPTGTINSLPDAVPGAAGGLLVDDVWTDARAAKLDNLDVAVSTRNATAPLDAAGTRAALGLAAANLDTQLSTIDDFLDTEVAAIKAKTDNLPSDPADASDIATATNAIFNRLGAPAGASMSADIAAIFARTDVATSTRLAPGDVVEGTTTWVQSARGWNAVMLGKSSGHDTLAPKYRDIADTKNRVDATQDADGNRTAVTRDLT